MKHKRNKKRNNSNRGNGPKAADDERLWKRLIPHIEDFGFEFEKRKLLTSSRGKKALRRSIHRIRRKEIGTNQKYSLPLLKA